MSSKESFKTSKESSSSSSGAYRSYGFNSNKPFGATDKPTTTLPSYASYRPKSSLSATGMSTNYSSRIISSGGIFVSSRSRFAVDMGSWHELPEDILLKIFVTLTVHDLASASRVCKHWNLVASSNYLWKRYFHKKFQQDASIPISPRAEGGWRGEFIRLVDEAPVMQCEVLKDHRSYVLHAAFSNSGHLFATCSFDAQVIVWSSDYPCQIVYQADLQRKYNWKFARYSQFNSSDTLLMVSGAYFGTGPFLTSGEVVVFDLENNFRLLSRTKNLPYDLFGAWITDDYLVTGELKWLQNMHSTSTLLLIRSTQEVSSEHVPILSTLLKLFNTNSACARCLLVAYRPEDGPPPLKREISVSAEPTHSSSLVYTPEYYEATDSQWQKEVEAKAASEDDSDDETLPQSLDDCEERLLIFTTGDRTFTPHQIGIIKLRPHMPDRVEVEHDIQELIRRKENIRRRVAEQPDVNIADYDHVRRLCHPLDHTIELAGSVVGMALSPDHRFLYVNTHPWPPNYVSVSPVSAPPIAAHLNTHVFDLSTLSEVGRIVHDGGEYVSSDESYYVFPAVSHLYFASGGEKSGRLWDRHYGLRVAELPHADSVSCAALSAARPQMMLTVSDDRTVKVWRSRREVRSLRIARASPAQLLLLPASV